MILRARDVERCLTRTLACERRDSHHTQYLLVDDGRLIAYTYMSHDSQKVIDAYLIRKMAEQLRVSRRTFVRAVECTASREDVLAEAKMA